MRDEVFYRDMRVTSRLTGALVTLIINPQKI